MSGLLERCEGLDPACREIVLSQYRYALELGAAHEDARASAGRLADALRETPGPAGEVRPAD